jgi:hypothetical protein
MAHHKIEIVRKCSGRICLSPGLVEFAPGDTAEVVELCGDHLCLRLPTRPR